MAILATVLTHDPLVIALISASNFLPWLFFGLPTGVLLDSRPTRTVAIYFAWLRSLGALILTILILIRVINPWILVVGVFVLASFQVVSDTAINALLPEVTSEEHIGHANGKMSSGQSTASTIAPLIGSSALELGRSLPFAISAGLGGVAAILLKSISPPPKPKITVESKEGIRAKLVQGFVAIYRTSQLRLLVSTVFFSNIAGGILIALLPLWALTILHLTPRELGLAASSQAVAMILGNMLASRVLRNEKYSDSLVKIGLLLKFPAILLIAFSNNLWTLISGMMLVGFTSGVWNVPSSSAVIIASAGPSRARIIATYKTISTLGAPLGALLGGLLALLLGLHVALIVSSAMALINGLFYIELRIRQKSKKRATTKIPKRNC